MKCLGYQEETIAVNQLDTMKNNLEEYGQPAECPIRKILDRFGDKWSILIILILGMNKKPMRFNEIMSTIKDVSQKMLTVTVRTLEADGLVSRKLYPEIPPRVEYELTPLGKELLPYIDSLAGWAAKNMDQIIKSRKKFELKAK